MCTAVIYMYMYIVHVHVYSYHSPPPLHVQNAPNILVQSNLDSLNSLGPGQNIWIIRSSDNEGMVLLLYV